MNTDGTSQDTGSNGLSEDQAADRIAELLAPKGDSADSETPKKPEAKAEEASDPDEDPDAEEAGEDDEEQSEEGEEPEEDGEQPPTFTVKVDGQDVEVTLDELQRGYSRTQDYTRKTMALAEAQKALEPERQALRAERDQYAQLLPRLEAHLQQQWEDPALQELRHTNPAEYLIRRDELAQQAAALQSERERLEKAQQEADAKEREETMKQEAQLLLSADPEFAKPGVLQEARAYAIAAGLPAEEVEDTVHHAAWVIVRKAMMYDQLKAKAPQTKAKVDAVKTAKPGPTQRQPSKVTDLTRAKQRLAQTGRVEDAQAAIERLLG